MRIDSKRFGKLRIALPSAGLLPIGGVLLLSFQPLGSFASLFLFIVMVGLMVLRERIPAKPMANWMVILAIYLAVLMVTWVMRSENILLFLLYSGYLTLLLLFGLMVGRVISAMSEEDRDDAILFILIADLAINMPSVLIELLWKGAGDPIQGFAGLIMSNNFSQGRTNAVRAGMLLSLALLQYSRRRAFIPAASAAFNASVLVLSTSMTTVLSVFGAGAVALFLTRQSNRTLKLGAIFAIAALGGMVNELMYNVSYAAYLLALNYHFTFTPKLNIYLHLASTVFPDRPLAIFFGNGLGNFMNRFAVLTNFENYSQMPFKEILMSLFASPDTRTHLVDTYNLEAGVQGNSILGVPWNSMLTVLLETGLLGFAFFVALLGRFFLKVGKVGSNLVGSGVFLLSFFSFNMLFDDYLDYPEVVCPFLLIACLFAASRNASQAATAAPFPPPAIP
ncbi:MAG: hypothetical protein M3Y08_08510 [Fibrobacterota bacterium]|nr:hypothetical protein [Fibrobacterota bacterium]